ncbi:SAC3/GANP/Nin1/mts3/eIF-3 p25 family-domain-containing protein [Lipomyces japonicus]|uniref:SAC3/GANP/Nin1/mts3/eIF-3 p25 family-domain-containing protein n=1 Tax=Lipomyces japonicus TaxID=56871 RepID=UPI0034CF8D52
MSKQTSRSAGVYRPPQGKFSKSIEIPDTTSAFSDLNYFQKGASFEKTTPVSRKQAKSKVIGKKKNATAMFNPDDDWDARNQANMSQMVETWSGDLQALYERLQQLRDKERIEMEKRGLVDRPDAQKNLNEAIEFRGTCFDMCPVFERVRRSFENNVAIQEKGPNGKIDRQLAVKAFSRPAAGQPPPLPSDVRPPGILQNTLTFLINTTVPRLPESHTFLWDRTRSIRQDFTYQNYSGPEAIDCNERIARIHIVSLHILAGSDTEYSKQQELEQFNKALQTLSEFYADARKKGAQCPNEAEFQAYRLLSHLRDPDIDRQIQDLPKNIFLDPQIQLALELRSLAQQNNITERGYINTENAQNLFVRFFRLVNSSSTPFLFACLAEVHFNDVRLWALKSMAAGYHKRGKPYLASALAQMLGCDDEKELLNMCEYWEIPIKESDGNMCVNVTGWNESTVTSKPPIAQAFSRKLVDVKQQAKPIELFVQGNNLEVYPQNSTTELRITEIFSNKDTAKINSKKSLINHYAQPSFSFGSLPSFESVQVSPEARGPSSGFAASQYALSFTKSSETGLHIQNSFASTFSAPSSTGFSFGSTTFGTPKNDGKPASSVPLLSSSTVKTFDTSTENMDLLAVSNKKFQLLSTQSTFQFEKPATDKIQLQFKSPIVIEEPKRSKEEKERRIEHFGQLELHKLTNSVVSESVAKAAQAVIERRRAEEKAQKEKFKNSIQEEIFKSMVFDNIWQAGKEAQAIDFRQKTLLRMALAKIKVVAKMSKEYAALKKKRQEEFETAIQILGRPVKRKRFSNPVKVLSEFLPESQQVELIKKELQSIQELWKPVNLRKHFLPSVEEYFVSSGVLDGLLDVAVFTSNWHSPSGIWIRRKLGLDWAKNTFCNVIEGESLTLTFSSMDSNPDSYENIGALIFQCGMTSNEDQLDANRKLQFDRDALHEALERLNKYSSYNISLLVVYWAFDSVSTQDMRRKLNLDYYLDPRHPAFISLSILTVHSVHDVKLISALEYLARSIRQ